MQKKHLRIGAIIALILAVVLCAVFIVVLSMKKSNPIYLRAAQLCEASYSNEARAKSDYGGQYVCLTGVVSYIGEDYILLTDSPESYPLIVIECYADKTKDLRLRSKGEFLSVWGFVRFGEGNYGLVIEQSTFTEPYLLVDGEPTQVTLAPTNSSGDTYDGVYDGVWEGTNFSNSLVWMELSTNGTVSDCSLELATEEGVVTASGSGTIENNKLNFSTTDSSGNSCRIKIEFSDSTSATLTAIVVSYDGGELISPKFACTALLTNNGYETPNFQDSIPPVYSQVDPTDFVGFYTDVDNFMNSLSIDCSGSTMTLNFTQYRASTSYDVEIDTLNMNGNTISFVVESSYETTKPYNFTMTYVPVESSPYGKDTIYLSSSEYDNGIYVRDDDSSYLDPYDSTDTAYLLPSDTQYITDYDLAQLSRQEVMLARNEIYARYGYTFNDDAIRTYFESQSWYWPNASVNASTFSTSMFNDYERANLETILVYEREMGWRS